MWKLDIVTKFKNFLGGVFVKWLPIEGNKNNQSRLLMASVVARRSFVVCVYVVLYIRQLLCPYKQKVVVNAE